MAAHGLGNVYVQQGQLKKGLAHHHEGWQLAEGKAQQSDSAFWLAAACTKAGQLEEAKIHCERAVAAAHDHPTGRLFHRLGSILARLGHGDEADEAYNQGLDHCRRLGHTADAALILADQAHLRMRQGQWEQARQLAEQALSLTTSKVANSFSVHNMLGAINNRLQADSLAEHHFQEAIRIASEAGIPSYQAVAWANYGAMAENRSQYPVAIERFQRALQLHQHANTPHTHVEALCDLGMTYKNYGDLDQARDCLRRAEGLMEKHNLQQAAEPVAYTDRLRKAIAALS